MAVDRFGSHSLKHYIYSLISSIEKSISSNIENKILKDFTSDTKYVENKITEKLDMRVSDNNEDIQDVAKKKIFEDKINIKRN